MLKPGKDYIGTGVGGVIIKDDKILLLLRKKEPEQNFWSIPGGAVEYGEKLEEAVLREIEEETGLKCEVIGLLSVTDQILKTPDNHWISLSYLLVPKNGKLQRKEPQKHARLEWISLNQLPENLTLATRDAIQAYKNYR